jgi:ABC-type multidrug transport system permease subunit
MALALVGATFVPIENYPAWLRPVSLLVPNGAAQQGLIGVLVRSDPVGAIAPHMATVWIWAAVMLIVALAVERRWIECRT